MTDAKDKDERKSLSLNKPRRLEIKKTVEGGQVRQSFSHGRSKTVQVEVRKRRSVPRDEVVSKPEAPKVEAKPAVAAPKKPAPAQGRAGARAGGRASGKGRVVLKQLTDDERAARVRALQGARVEAEKVRQRAEQEAAQREVEQRSIEGEKAG